MANIKIIIKSIVKPLTFICNQSFLTGIFSHGMNIARAMPIFKSGGKNIFSYSGRTSILPQQSKNLRKTSRCKAMCLYLLK